ncbi:Uncharacterised protein [uncultured archaeon]|nr:Uncharacterised protein [uncultured archaeon]
MVNKNTFLIFGIFLFLTFNVTSLVVSDSTLTSEWNMFHRTLNHSGYYPD